MKKFIAALAVLVVFACKDEAKKETPQPEQTVTEYIDPLFPQSEVDLSNAITLFDNGFDFTETLKVNEIATVATADGMSRLVYYIDSASDFEALQGMNVAFRVYPEDPAQFTNAADQKAAAKTFAASGKNIYAVGRERMLISDPLDVQKIKYTKAKVYFYNPDNNETTRRMTVLEPAF